MIGKRPKTAPSVADSSASPTGMRYAVTATMIATATEASPAQCALTRSQPSRTKIVSEREQGDERGDGQAPQWGEILLEHVVGSGSWSAVTTPLATYGLTNSGADRTDALP